MHQVWGYNAAGSSGYTKEIALFHDSITREWEFVVRPAIAAPPIVIKLPADVATALRDVLSGYSIA